MLAALLCLLLSPRPAPPAPAIPEPPARASADEGPGADEKLVIDDKTEVWLDGKRCAFADVPPGAPIIDLAVAADKKTITRIRFASKPK